MLPVYPWRVQVAEVVEELPEMQKPGQLFRRVAWGGFPESCKNWGQLVMPMIDNTIAAARANRVRILLPGTIYNHGPDALPVLREGSPQRATTHKGTIRIALEASPFPWLVIWRGSFFTEAMREIHAVRSLWQQPKRPRRSIPDGRLCYVSLLLFRNFTHMEQNESTAPQGATQAPADYFAGTTWVKTLVAANNLTDCVVSEVTFEPGARNNWHTHPNGQILVATAGTGYYQEKGKPIQLLREGTAVNIAPNLVHWHGATPNGRFTHIAINPNVSKGGAVAWLQPVTDDEYNSYLSDK